MSSRVGAFGDPLAVTPNFDQLAREGVRYTNVFTTAGVCAPSRASLVTGRHQMSTGTQHMRVSSSPPFETRGPQNYEAVPPASVKAYPELLRANGYYTSNNFKNDYQIGEPFTIWDENSMTADWSGRAEGQPFFAMFTIMQTHESFLWPIEREPSNAVEKLMFAMIKQAAPGRKFINDPAKVVVPPYYPDNADVRAGIARQYDNIAYADALLGKIITKLKADGLYDKSIIVVSTDHGDGLPRAKRTLYDSGLKVPMVIRHPSGHGAGTVDDQLISFVDLTKTFLSWTNTKLPDGLDGNIFAGPSREKQRQYIYAEQDRMDEITYRYRAVRDKRFKYIRNYRPGEPYFQTSAFRDTLPMMQSLWAEHRAGTLPLAAEAMFQPIPRDQLFDLENDPYEIHNLGGDPKFKTVQQRMEAALDRWMNSHADWSEKSEAEMIEDMWPGGVQPVTADPVISVTRQGDDMAVTLSSTTPGASIGYQTGEPGKHWFLYSKKLTLPSDTMFRTKAVRYGFKVSNVVERKLP